MSQNNPHDTESRRYTGDGGPVTTSTAIVVAPPVLTVTPIEDLFRMLVSITPFGAEGLIFLILTVFFVFGWLDIRRDLEGEAGTAYSTDIGQSETTAQTEANTDPIVQEALNEVAADMDTEDTRSSEFDSSGKERCADCGDIASRIPNTVRIASGTIKFYFHPLPA